MVGCRRLVWTSLLVGAAACAQTPRSLSWEAHFTDAALAGQARALEVEIRTSGCTGAAVWSLTYKPSAPPPSMGPPELGPGRYGFAIVARDAACMRYAQGCTEVDLPQASGSTVVVTLEPFGGSAACGGGACGDGLCSELDAGAPDSGVPDSDAGTVVCPADQGDCNGITADGCETPLDEISDCGSCNTVCALDHATPACTAGSCAVVACEDDWADCNAVAADGCETSLRSADHCGACGTTCQLANAEESCQSMRCELVSCYPGFSDCDAIAGTGCETSVATGSDCGACGTACADPTPVCGVDATSGSRTCLALCAAPAATQCGTGCFDTFSDPQACGSCGVTCRSDHAAGVCGSGACGRGSCDGNWADCNGLPGDGCERPTTTNTDCGACGATCSATTARVSCGTGSCVVDVCNSGLGDCDALGANGCEADLAAPSTCGDCTTTCSGTAPACGRLPSGARSCLAACAAPEPDRCGDRCFDTSTDIANCGGCGLACALANASAACAGGGCVLGGCVAGFGDCDSMNANGCESHIASDAANCGACGIACPSRSGASAACGDSACMVVCDSGFGDCDGDELTGCETSVSTTTDCGTCGATCSPANATGNCSARICRITSCNAGFGDCDGLVSNGCETPLSADRANCGTCGMRCTGGTRDCCAGTCGICA